MFQRDRREQNRVAYVAVQLRLPLFWSPGTWRRWLLLAFVSLAFYITVSRILPLCAPCILCCFEIFFQKLSFLLEHFENTCGHAWNKLYCETVRHVELHTWSAPVSLTKQWLGDLASLLLLWFQKFVMLDTGLIFHLCWIAKVPFMGTVLAIACQEPKPLTPDTSLWWSFKKRTCLANLAALQACRTVQKMYFLSSNGERNLYE